MGVLYKLSHSKLLPSPGEDRWLCTLLLQQGYRVAYVAAADALTFAPETFREFYNQRRRWAPSTMANIIDLLSSFKSTVNKNDNISYLYMFYQFVLFVTSVLSPGTTLMMIAGSYNAVLGTDQLHSNLLALGPIVLFVLICFTTHPDTHILVAMLLSALYSVVMTIVIVGTVVNAIDESLTSPNIVFMATLVGFFLLAGFLHPQEIFNLAPGVIYFLAFPSAYLMLPLYALCNLNVVTWGTREISAKKTKEELEAEKKALEEKRKKEANKRKGLLNWLGIDGFLQDLKDFYNSMLTRVRPGAGPQETQLTSGDQVLLELKNSVDRLNTTMSDRDNATARQREAEEGADAGKGKNALQLALEKKTKQDAETREATDPLTKQAQDSAASKGEMERKAKKKAGKLEKSAKKSDPVYDTVKVERDELVNPVWIEHEGLGCGRIASLKPRECAFWRQLIRLHLKPIEKDKKKEERMEAGLKSLRDSIVFVFLLMNFLWNIAIFQMQLLKGKLEEFFVPIPRADDPDGEPMRFEPMGFAFLAVFGLVLALQFIGTVIHRWHTLLHILSRTEIRPTENSKEGKLKLAEKLQSINEIEEDDDFGIPPPDYDDIHFLYYPPGKPDNDSGLNIEFDSNRNSFSRPDRWQLQQRGMQPGMPHTPHGSSQDFQRYQADSRRYQKYDPGRNKKRRYSRQYPGMIHVGANSLSRNFMRRFNFLQDYNPEDHVEAVAVDMERGRMGYGQQGALKQKGGFNQVYRTVRGMSHQYAQAVMGHDGQIAHEKRY